MDKLANDKMLAEFMGIDKCANISYSVDSGPDDYYYHPSENWNQLMEIVEKIEGNKDSLLRVDIYNDSCDILDLMADSDEPIIVTKSADTKIQAVYQAVSEYVKQYGGI